MATTPKQRGNSWHIRWRLGGGRTGAWQALSFTGDDLDAAHQLALAAKALVEAHGHRMTREEVKARILGEEPVADGAPTLAKWVALWLQARRPVNPDKIGEEELLLSTWSEYARVLRLRVLPYLGHHLVRDLTEDMLKDWVRTLMRSRVRRTRKKPNGVLISPNSVRRAHEVLHQVLGAAVPEHLDRNPAAKPAGSRKNRLGLPKTKAFEGMFLTPDEVDLIHDNCPEAIADLWCVLVRTGLRLGEALALRVKDVTVDGDAPEIRVRRALKNGQKIGPPKSVKSVRDVTISDLVADVLRVRCEGRRPNDLIFPSPRGKLWQKYNLYRRYYLPAVAAAMRCAEHQHPPRPASRWWNVDEVTTCGCPGVLQRRPRLHDARHTEASRCIAAGWEPMEVMDRLGHASYNTTMAIYGHLWKKKGEQHERLNEMERQRLIVEDEAA